MPPCARERDLAQTSRVEILALRLEVVRTGALLHSDLADPLIDASRLDDGRTLLNGEGEGLLDVDVFAGLEGIDCGVGVPMIRRGVEYYV
jgi:hypothetical protein